MGVSPLFSVFYFLNIYLLDNFVGLARECLAGASMGIPPCVVLEQLHARAARWLLLPGRRRPLVPIHMQKN
jgi:hypothetical protein